MWSQPAPADATAKADAHERDVRVLLADFADNAVTVRWVIAGAVPTTVPCPIPDLALENLGTQEVRDRIDAVVGPIRKTIATYRANFRRLVEGQVQVLKETDSLFD